MKKKDVKVGETYWVKVGAELTQVKVIGVSKYGGWDGKSLATGRAIRLKTAGRLREKVWELYTHPQAWEGGMGDPNVKPLEFKGGVGVKLTPTRPGNPNDVEIDFSPVDVVVDDQGTVVALTPTSDAGREWLVAHCAAAPWQWLGRTLAVQHQYAPDILRGLAEAGLKVGQ